MDAGCHRLTASFVREQHKSSSSVPVCSFFEVSATCRERNKEASLVLSLFKDFDSMGRTKPLPPGIYDLVCVHIRQSWHCAVLQACLPPSLPAGGHEGTGEAEGVVSILHGQIYCESVEGYLGELIVRCAF